MICVDGLTTYPENPHGHGRWAHLFDDGGDVAALHAFARTIGLKPAWFQNRPGFPHYDVTAGKHAAALKAGARLVTWREVAAVYNRR